MAVKLLISATLRTFAGRKSEIVLEGSTVQEVLDRFTDEYPDAGKALFGDDRRLRPFVNVYVGGNNIDALDGLETKLEENDTVLLVPVIVGGAPEEGVISEERRKAVTLDDKEIDRYNKHLMLREIGVKGQKKLKAAKVLIAGLGGLGTPLVQYLAAAGVGTIGIVDFDEVSLTNLQSQVIHGTRDVNRPKTASAKDSIKAINPLIKVETYHIKLTEENIEEIIEDYDIVADATDNYKSRYLINDACVLLGKPLVFGAMYQFEGQVSVFDARRGPCFRCQFPSPPPKGLVPTCAESGVIGTLPGIIGSIQANEVLKLIIGGGESLIGEMFLFDTWNFTGRKLSVAKNENCPICGKNPTIYKIEEFDYEDFCGLKEDEEEVPVEGITPEDLADRIERGEPLTIVDVREPHERSISRFPNAVVIPIGQLARRQNELDPDMDTIFICREGKRSILAINTLREAGYKGPMYNLKGGMEAARDIIFSNEGGWL
ncbi:MAG: molybdopterin-synthase adenylyltransferase MoeB [Lachnospiraceae bacterium]|nr:molybdopterin-synthase adenylyltransferase MoeB [Lachnospiraceae bacterium]